MVGLKLPPGVFVKAISMLYTTAGAFLMISGAAHGTARDGDMLISAAGMIPVYGGMLVGQRLRNRLNADRFRVLVLITVVITGAKYAAHRAEALSAVRRGTDGCGPALIRRDSVADGGVMAFSISSSAFENNGAIPPRFTRDGENVSPPLQWRNVPKEAQSLALVVEDPDAPSGIFRHWAVYDISPSQSGLREGLSAAEADNLGYGVNDFGYARYDGPQPPQGSGPHHYHFRLFALDVPTLELASTAKVEEVLAAARRHKVGEAEIVGLFQG